MSIELLFHTANTAIPVKSMLFGGGESHIKLLAQLSSAEASATLSGLLDKEEKITVKCIYNQDSDLVQAGLVKDALESLLVGKRSRPQIVLDIPYFPGARQDRYCAIGEPFSAKFYANLVNSFGFDAVKILDPHSDVITALVNNCVVESNHDFVAKVIRQLNFKGVILSPDAGSNKKIFALVNDLERRGFGWFAVIRADKRRDTSNGKIIGSEILLNDFEGRDVLIVDDICSYGGTFRTLAREAVSLNAGKVYLAVTHYEGTAVMDGMAESGITHIYTANNKQHFLDSRLTTISIDER